MNETLLLAALFLILWCFSLTLAVIALWLRFRSDPSESHISRLRRELQQLSARVDQLVSATARPPAQPQAPETPRQAPAAAAGPSVPVLPHTEPAAPPPKPPGPPPLKSGGQTFKKQARRFNPELEALIGGNWLLKIGILAIVLGTVYFLKYAFDNEWIGNWGRVLLGALAGIVLLGAGEMFQKKKYPLYGQVLVAGGISILYLAIYAAFNFYALVAQPPAFLCMAAVTAAGSLLARRHRSKTLAVMSLLGGLMTPLWLNTGRNNEVGLLGYLLILDAGIGLLARRQGWHFLNMLSLGGTVILFYLWAMRYYGPYALWTTEIFLVLFTLLYLFLFRNQVLSEPRRSGSGWDESRPHPLADARGSEPGGQGPIFSRSDTPPANVGPRFGEPMMAIVVILFFFSSSAILAPDPIHYWTFLVLFDAISLRVSLAYPERGIAPGIFVLNVLGIAFWMPDHYYPSERNLVFLLLSCVFLLFLVQQILHRRISEKAADVREVLSCLGTGIGYFGTAYFVMHLAHRRWMGLFAIALAALYLASSRFLFRSRETARPVAQAFLGTAVTLVTLAIPIELHAHWITLGWAAEAVVLTWIGFSTRRIRFRQAGLAVLGIAVLRLLAVDTHANILQYTLILNRRFFTFAGVIAAVYLLAYVYRRNRTVVEKAESSLLTFLTLLASALSVILISVECWAYYQEILRRLMESLNAGLVSRPDYLDERNRINSVRQVALSILWSGYSIAAVVAGIRFRFRPIRILGIGLFFVTIVKVFSVDIWTLERLDRIISTITLGLILLGAAFLYQRFRKLVVEE